MKTGEYAGKPFMVSKFYTLSLNEKASLRKDLQSWRGKPFTEEELKGFDVEKLIGANCLLNIVEYEKLDKSSGTKIAAIMPLTKGMQKMNQVCTKCPDWVSKKRNESLEVSGGEFGSDPDPCEEPKKAEDDLPF
jgi:hypothetical protein